MSLSLIYRLISSFCLTTTMALAISMSKPGCPEKCGNITIPYPFGIGSDCSANSNFTVICNFSKPFLSSIDMEALHVSLLGSVVVNLPVSPLNCSYDEPKTAATSLVGSLFTISPLYNALAVLGCQNSVTLHNINDTSQIGGCTYSRCSSETNYCQVTIPHGVQELQYTYQSFRKTLVNNNNSFCGYAFPVERTWFAKDYTSRYQGLLVSPLNPFDPDFRFAPLVLEWDSSGLYSACNHNGYNSPYAYYPTTKACYCPQGHDGNPYLHGGCIECRDSTLYISKYLSVLGALILLLASWKSTKAIKEKVMANRKQNLFKRDKNCMQMAWEKQCCLAPSKPSECCQATGMLSRVLEVEEYKLDSLNK